MLFPTVGCAAGLLFYSFFIEPRLFRLKQHTVTLPGISRAPLRILHLSDLHFFKGQHARRAYLHRLAQELSTLDFLFITGDLIDDDSGIDLCLDALQPFQSQYGGYAVLGNHDHSFVRLRDVFHNAGSYIKRPRSPNNTTRLIQGLAGIGVTVLRNERCTVPVGEGKITIAGLDDPYLRKADVAKTFAGYTKNEPCLALSHTPDPYPALIEAGADMIFTGHTHGGQIRVPLLGPVITRTTAPRHVVHGLTRHQHAWLYNTCGLGSSRNSYPRFACRPEATLFTLEWNNK